MPAPDDLLDVVRGNFGFDDEPEAWLAIAARDGFEPVQVEPIERCPDCGSPPAGRVGRYVHCSSLLSLLECHGCGLIWVNGRIEERLRRKHFEAAYKSADYFTSDRRRIFEHLTSLLVPEVPEGGSVLDIGGATGQLLEHLRSARPDLNLMLQDFSERAVQSARDERALEATTQSPGELARSGGAWDAVVLSDVIYYEPAIGELWEALDRLVKPGGSILIRVPNRALLIRTCASWQRLPMASGREERLSRLRFFNPEHMLICTRGYLTRRLGSLGFDDVRTHVSPPLGDGALPKLLNALARSAHTLSLGSLALSPAVVLQGRRAS